MDGGLFNTPRSTDRRTTNRPTVAERKPETPSVHTATPVASEPRHNPAPRKGHRSSKMRLFVIIAVVVVALAVAGIWFYLQRGADGAGAIDTTKYQAVFLNGGQVYFGKLTVQSDQYLKLTHVFYIQTSSKTTASDDAQTASSPELIKLGSEVHGPEDAMIINRDQVLFYENLKSDGKVSELIKKYK